MKGHCAKCGLYTGITVDHIVPAWFVNRIPNLGIIMPQHPVQMLCTVCNREKGGGINWEDPRVKAYMTKFAEMILEKVKN